MPSVISVQRFSVPLTAGQVSNSATLTAGTVTANCVPFMNGRKTEFSDTQAWSFNAVNAYFSGNDIVVATSDAALRALDVEVTVVEFDPAEVRVQQVPYSILNLATSDAVAISPVVLANTFAISAWQKTGTSRSNMDVAIRTAFTSTTELTLDRIGVDGDITGNAYVMESIAGAFTVQTVAGLVSSINVTATIPVAVTMNKTLLVTSYNANSGTGVNGNLCPYIHLLSPTEVFLERGETGGSIDAVAFVVSFAPGGAEVIQRGLLTQTVVGGTASEDMAITQVDLNRAMAWMPTSMSFRCGKTGGITTAAIPDSRVGLTFASNIALRFERSTFDATPLVGTSNIYSWEVIEWDTAAAAVVSRRVLVRS